MTDGDIVLLALSGLLVDLVNLAVDELLLPLELALLVANREESLQEPLSLPDLDPLDLEAGPLIHLGVARLVGLGPSLDLSPTGATGVN